MSLQLQWVDKIFSKLTVTYGRDFIGRWEGLDLDEVKADWAHELAGFKHFPEGIAFALGNMPAGRPPNVLEFKAIALKAPRPVFKPLEAPSADVSRATEELHKAVAAAKLPARNGVDHKAWAKHILARHEAGEKVHPICLRFALEALNLRLMPNGEIQAGFEPTSA